MKFISTGFWPYIIFILILFSCEEQLPPRIRPVNLLVGVVQAETKRSAICTSGLPHRPIVLYVGVKNIFDETLQNTKNVKIALSVWTVANPSVKKTLVFDSVDPEEVITIDPGQTYWVKMEWDHRDTEGNLVWLAIKAPEIDKWGYEIKFRAVGTMQVFENVPPVPTVEIEFPILYYFDPKC